MVGGGGFVCDGVGDVGHGSDECIACQAWFPELGVGFPNTQLASSCCTGGQGFKVWGCASPMPSCGATCAENLNLCCTGVQGLRCGACFTNA